MKSRPSFRSFCLLLAAIITVVGLSAEGARNAAEPGQAASKSSKPAQVSGRDLYVNYCGSCHGKQAKGDGPLANDLRNKPTDLTLLAKKNGGKFPAEMVLKEIDGKNPEVRSHGTPDMPVWGDVFTQVRDYTTLQAKLNALVKYLESVQAK